MANQQQRRMAVCLAPDCRLDTRPSQVFDFSPRQLVQVIRGLAGLAHHRKDSLVDDDDADPGLVVPARLLDDGSRVLARAVAANALSAHDIVEVGVMA